LRWDDIDPVAALLLVRILDNVLDPEHDHALITDHDRVHDRHDIDSDFDSDVDNAFPSVHDHRLALAAANISILYFLSV
jgi:hypothetical protein